MRSAVTILALFAAASAGVLAFHWIGELGATADALARYRPLLELQPERAAQLEELDDKLRAAWVLGLAGLAMLAGAALNYRDRTRAAGVVLVIASVVPPCFEPTTLAFTALALIAAALAFVRPSLSSGAPTFRRV